MRRPIALLSSSLFFLLATTAGCSPAYSSFYKETNHKDHPAPVAAKNVKVVKSKDKLTSEWFELGIYRGQAPTVKEAMSTAQQQCGSHGGNVYVLNTEPFQSGDVWKVDGVCGRMGK